VAFGKRKVGMIGHSHAVCLLDALGPWREHASMLASRPDHRYGEAFQGWFEWDTKGKSFLLRPCGAVSAAPSELVVCLVAGAMQTMLIQLPPATIDDATEGDPTPPFLRYLDDLRDSDVVVSALFGNEVASLQLVDDLDPYDFAGRDGLSSSSWSWPDSRYRPIDRADIERTILLASSSVILTIATLRRRLPLARLVHVLPPPPLKHPERVPRRELLNDLIARHGFVRAKLRLKWHFAYCAQIEAAIRDYDVEVLRPPDRAHTRDGFLREELSEGLTHGNGVYGSMLWTDLAQLLN
jgi:hypothetical protein